MANLKYLFANFSIYFPFFSALFCFSKDKFTIVFIISFHFYFHNRNDKTNPISNKKGQSKEKCELFDKNFAAFLQQL